VQRLADAGHTVTGFDVRRDRGQDITVLPALHNACQDVEIVVHTAAIPHPNKGDLTCYHAINVMGTLNVLLAAHRAGVRRVVYTSSTGFYGCDIQGRLLPAYLPIDERHPIAMTPGCSTGALDAYNQSKVMAEALLAWYGTQRCLETVVLRIAPANTKAEQYRPDLTWDCYTDWRRGALFCNCHPDYAADALVLATLAEGPFWYEVFNVVDAYTHQQIDARAFAQKYFGVEPAEHWQPGESLISSHKLRYTLGWSPCEDVE
jgi:nucleoside-diphosphate-sugar epimerase